MDWIGVLMGGFIGISLLVIVFLIAMQILNFKYEKKKREIVKRLNKK